MAQYEMKREQGQIRYKQDTRIITDKDGFSRKNKIVDSTIRVNLPKSE